MFYYRQTSFPSASSELSLPVDDWATEGFRSTLGTHKGSFDSADGRYKLIYNSSLSQVIKRIDDCMINL